MVVYYLIIRCFRSLFRSNWYLGFGRARSRYYIATRASKLRCESERSSAALAQLVEQRFCKAKVPGSSPGGGSSFVEFEKSAVSGSRIRKCLYDFARTYFIKNSLMTKAVLNLSAPRQGPRRALQSTGVLLRHPPRSPPACPSRLSHSVFPRGIIMAPQETIFGGRMGICFLSN